MWLPLSKRHQLFVKNQCKASLEGDKEGFGFSKSILTRNVFCEALEIVSPTAILQIDYTTLHIAYWLGVTSCYSFIIKNYRFVNENLSKRLQPSKDGLQFTTASTGSDRDLKTLSELRSSSFFRNQNTL